MVVGFTTIYAINASTNLVSLNPAQARRTLYNIMFLWFSQSTPVSSTNKTDRHDLTEILLEVALNTITPSYVWQQ